MYSLLLSLYNGHIVFGVTEKNVNGHTVQTCHLTTTVNTEVLIKIRGVLLVKLAAGFHIWFNSKTQM